MTRTILAAMALSALAFPALAQPKYDRRLEKAVMEILAGRIDGNLRGSFAWDREPAVPRQWQPLPAPVSDEPDWSLR